MGSRGRRVNWGSGGRHKGNSTVVVDGRASEGVEDVATVSGVVQHTRSGELLGTLRYLGCAKGRSACGHKSVQVAALLALRHEIRAYVVEDRCGIDERLALWPESCSPRRQRQQHHSPPMNTRVVGQHDPVNGASSRRTTTRIPVLSDEVVCLVLPAGAIREIRCGRHVFDVFHVDTVVLLELFDTHDDTAWPVALRVPFRNIAQRSGVVNVKPH